MTARSAAVGKDKGRPWTFGKDFDQSAPVGPIHPASKSGHRKKASSAQGEWRAAPDSDIDQIIWSVPEQIAFLTQYYSLEAGDLIMTGTPSGVGPPSRAMSFSRNRGPGELRVKILPPR